MPSAATVALNVSNGGSLLGTETFKVSKVPRPTLQISIGGTPANDPRGVPVSSARSVKIQAVPDPSFAIFSPEDARFRTTGATISLVRGTKRVTFMTVGPGGGPINSIAAEAQPGDRIVIQIDGVQRQNFRGEVSDVPMGNPLQQVSLY